jgi:hypothetical protein
MPMTGTTSFHCCRVCDTTIAPSLLMCYMHWHMVPLNLRRRFLFTVPHDANIYDNPSPATLAAIEDCEKAARDRIEELHAMAAK